MIVFINKLCLNQRLFAKGEAYISGACYRADKSKLEHPESSAACSHNIK